MTSASEVSLAERRSHATRNSSNTASHAGCSRRAAAPSSARALAEATEAFSGLAERQPSDGDALGVLGGSAVPKAGSQTPSRDGSRGTRLIPPSSVAQVARDAGCNVVLEGRTKGPQSG
jgi:hypothetical protein